jgi:CheY-like chemotaxis protein
MAKIMLVEDDTNLSEIYRARLEAEGYQIVSANDGEEALAMAVKEKPDLIICDVMMPKISGFEMLDILRGTQGVQNTKVIMMTALSQAEDKARASALGADRYLVKSQVTLEDVVTSTKDVLKNNSSSAAPTASEPAVPTTMTAEVPAQAPAPMPEPVAVAATAPTLEPAPIVPPAPAAPVSAPEPAPSPQPLPAPTPEPVPVPEPVAAAPAPEPVTPPTAPEPLVEPAAPAATPPVKSHDGVNIVGKKVISPLNDMHSQPNLELLLAKEAQKEAEQGTAVPVINGTPQPPAPSTGYLGAPPQAPNSSADFDPGSISL